MDGHASVAATTQLLTLLLLLSIPPEQVVAGHREASQLTIRDIYTYIEIYIGAATSRGETDQQELGGR